MFEDGDNISLYLDLRNQQIYLTINGKDYGVAFRDIVKSMDTKYRLFVSLCGINDCVEILDFTKY